MTKVINKLLAVTLSFAMVLTGFTFLGGSFATYADDGDKPEFVMIERGETEFLPASGGTCSWYAMDGNFMGLNGQVTEADFKLQVKTADADWADASVGSLALQPDEEEFDVIVTATIPENADAVQKEWRVVYKYSEIGTQYETENAIKVTQDAASDTPSEKPDFVIIDREEGTEEFQPASGGNYVWYAQDGNYTTGLYELVTADDFKLQTKKVADNDWTDATEGTLRIEWVDEWDARIYADIPENTNDYDIQWILVYKHSEQSTQYPSCESVAYTQLKPEAPVVEKPELVEISVDTDETQPAAGGEYAWYVWTEGDFEDAEVSSEDFTMQVKAGDGDWTDSDAAVEFELGTNYDEGLVTATIPDNEEEVAKQWRFVYAGGGIDCPAITQEAYEEPVVEWTKDDFTTSGSAVTGLTESGTAKLDVLPEVTFPADDSLTTINAFFGASTAAKANQKITGAIIPDNYTTLASGAFRNCKNLTSVSLGSGLKTINNNAFANTGLTSVEIPAGVETMGSSAFATATLTDLTLNEGIKTIGAGVFANANIESVDLPKSVETLAPMAFGTKADKTKRTVIVPAEGAEYGDGVARVGNGHIFDGYVLDITLDVNGGSEAATTTAKADKTSTLWDFNGLPKTEKEGYVFAGWFTAAEGGDEVTAATVFDEECTIYAHWTKEFTVTFEKNAEDAVLDTTSAKTDKDGKVALPTPTRSGYVFAGWFTDAEAGEKVEADKVYEEDMTLFAHWDGHYTVTFDPAFDGATVDPSTAETNDEAKLEIDLPTPVIEGDSNHIFVGWYLEDGTKVSKETVYSADTVVSAKWTDKSWGAEDFEYGEWDFVDDLMIDGAAWRGILWSVTGLSDAGKAKLAEGCTDLVIPAADPDGKTVQGVSGSFTNMGITSVVFPEGIYTEDGSRGDFFLKANTFNNNSITELTVPEGVVFIGVSAFSGNKLKQVEFPKSLMTIGNNAFMSNADLSKLAFPESGSNLGIGNLAFARCGLSAVQLPKTIVQLSNATFMQNPVVVSVYIDGKGAGGGIAEPNANSHKFVDGVASNKVKFEANGGTVDPAEAEIKYGKIESFLPLPVKENSAFLGWFTAEEGGDLVEGQIFAQEDITLYAHWSDNADLVDVQQKTIDAVSSTLDAAEANEAAKNAAKGAAAVKAAAAAKKTADETLAKANEAKQAADELVAKMDADESVDKNGEEYAAAKKAAEDAAKAVGAATGLAGEAAAIQAQAKKDAQAMYAPGKVNLKKVVKGKKRVTATWKTIKKNVTGYQVQIINRKTGKVVRSKYFKQTKKLAKKSSFKKVVKSAKLKKGKFKVRVRAYRTVGGIKYYGAWSKYKYVKFK